METESTIQNEAFPFERQDFRYVAARGVLALAVKENLNLPKISDVESDPSGEFVAFSIDGFKDPRTFIAVIEKTDDYEWPEETNQFVVIDESIYHKEYRTKQLSPRTYHYDPNTGEILYEKHRFIINLYGNVYKMEAVIKNHMRQFIY